MSGSRAAKAGECGLDVAPTEQSSGGEMAVASMLEQAVEKEGHCEKAHCGAQVNLTELQNRCLFPFPLLPNSARIRTQTSQSNLRTPPSPHQIGSTLVSQSGHQASKPPDQLLSRQEFHLPCLAACPARGRRSMLERPSSSSFPFPGPPPATPSLVRHRTEGSEGIHSLGSRKVGVGRVHPSSLARCAPLMLVTLSL